MEREIFNILDFQGHQKCPLSLVVIMAEFYEDDPRSCKWSKTLLKSLLFLLAGEVSWLAVEVLSQCQK